MEASVKKWIITKLQMINWAAFAALLSSCVQKNVGADAHIRPMKNGFRVDVGIDPYGKKR